MTYKANDFNAKIGTLIAESSNSTPTLFLSKYFISAPAARTCIQREVIGARYQ